VVHSEIWPGTIGQLDTRDELSEWGWPRLMAPCDAIAEVALEAPEMARGLAVPVLDHFELVGLDPLYDKHVGEALAAMVAVAGCHRTHRRRSSLTSSSLSAVAAPSIYYSAL
jgi:hypothetical protein